MGRTTTWDGSGISVIALISSTLSTFITVQVVRTDMTNDMEDYLAYGIVPGLGYIGLLGAAVSRGV